MINRSELTQVGVVIKTHGVRGEVNVGLDIAELDFADISCVFMDFDGLAVPFFIASVRPRGREAVLITLDDVESDIAAARFVGKPVYVKSEFLQTNDDEADGFYLSDLIGYDVYADGEFIGTVDDFDDSTANVLMLVSSPKGDIIRIPAADEFFVGIDSEARNIELDLPEGLLDI